MSQGVQRPVIPGGLSPTWPSPSDHLVESQLHAPDIPPSTWGQAREQECFCYSVPLKQVNGDREIEMLRVPSLGYQVSGTKAIRREICM